jgi:drug/metabolite transporter (DMT)-like permease
MAVALAFLSAVLYGVSDYVGGRASRRSPATAVALVAELVVFGLCIVIVPLIESEGPTSRAIWWGLAAGVTSSVGVVGLYVALARGNMTVVAPVTGLVAAMVPVAVGILTGDRPSPLAIAGIVAAIVAVAMIGGIAGMFAGGGAAPPVDPRTVALALGVGFSFGLLFISLDRSGDDAGQWPLLFARFTALPVLLVAALFQFRGKRPAFGRQLVVPAAIVGVLIALSNASYLISTREGLLSVVAVVVAMYPASTIVLAAAIDGERATRSQLIGMALAAGALVMITTGS